MANKNFDEAGFYAVITLSQFVIAVIILSTESIIINIIDFIMICLLSVVMYLFDKEIKSSGQKHPVKPNNTHPSTPVHKENQIIPKNESVKQSCSPNMSEVVKLTKQVESIKDSFKVINYEVDDSIFVKFEFLKDTVYARINKIDWQNNKNPELVKKYQTVVDSYVEKLDNEYLNIKKQFDDIVDNDVKHEIDNVSLFIK